jgi:prepilin-type N-terminal cleavage/methylation domain-containing protein
MRQRGMTLLEVLIAVAIVVLCAAAGIGLAQGARAFGMRSSTGQFDAVLAYAQSLAAASGNGATIGFDKNVAPGGAALPGFVLTVYAGRPTAAGAMHQSSLAPLQSPGTVTEAKLGGVPFTIFLNSAAHASATVGTVTTASVLAADPGCPPGESAVVLKFADARSSDARTIPCNAAVAGSPVPLATP